ncbi:recombinase family protein [Blautia pseudococcoides]
MFTKYSEGATMQELVNLLNDRGMRSIRGGKITLNIMYHLLKNRRYMGEYSYRDVVKEDGIPAIVPKELFERVQERLAKNKNGSKTINLAEVEGSDLSVLGALY